MTAFFLIGRGAAEDIGPKNIDNNPSLYQNEGSEGNEGCEGQRGFSICVFCFRLLSLLFVAMD